MRICWAVRSVAMFKLACVAAAVVWAAPVQAESRVGHARWQPLSHHEPERPTITRLEETHQDLPVVEIRFGAAESWTLAMLQLRPQRDRMAGATRMRLWLRAADEASVGRGLEFSDKTTDNKRRWQYPRLAAEWTALDVTLDPELIARIDVATLGLAKNDQPLRVQVAGPLFDAGATPQAQVQTASVPQVAPRQTVDPATLPNYGGWRSGRIGGGGWIQGVVPALSDPQRFYAYVDIGGLYRSDDGGQTWRMLHQHLPHGHVRSVSVDPRDADVVLAAIGKRTWGQGVYRSEDGGATWTLVLRAEFHGNDTPVARAAGVVLARHPDRPDVVLAASRNDGVFRSEDGGLSWTLAGVKNQIPQDLVIDRTNPDRAWLCTYTDARWNKEGGLYRSDDGGRTWRKIVDQAPGELVQDPVDGQVVYGLFNESLIQRSTDGGATWTDWSNGLPINPDAARRDPVNEHRFLALATGPDFILTASTRGTFYRLAAGESQWHRIGRERVTQGDWPLSRDRIRRGEFDFMGASLASITVSPHDADHWFWTDWFGVYQSTDGGRTWNLTVEGIECTVVHDLLIDPRDPNLIHAGLADIGYLRSTDGGLTFDRGYLPVGQGLNIRMVAAPTEGDGLFAVGSRGSQWVSDQLFVSDDRGRSWRRVTMTGYPVGQARCVAVAVNPRNPQHVAVTASGPVGPGRGGVYVSSDGGENFTWAGQGLPDGQGVFKQEIWGGGRHLVMLDDGTLVALRRDRPQVFVRGTDADAWQVVNLPVDGRPLTLLFDPADAASVYLVVQNSALLHSDDRGITWRKLVEGPVSSAAVSGDGRTLAARIGGGPTRLSTDRGASWHPHEDDPGSLPLGPALQLTQDRRLIAGSDGNGVFWIDLDLTP
jgi:photosystem II stability/assembly factor-like uncharacterized protein